MSRRRSIRVFILITLLLLPRVPSAAGAGELLLRALEALGGEEALSEIRSVVTVADVEMIGLGAKGTMASHRMSPCLYRTDISLGFFEITQGYDGERIWRIDPNGMVVYMQDAESIAERITTCLVDSYRYLLSGEGFTARISGTDTIGGASCTSVELRPEEGIPCLVCFDDETHLPVRISMQTKNGPVRETYGDYRPVKGVMFPHLTRIEQLAINQTIEVRTRSLQVNEPVDPLLFLPPPGAVKDYSFTQGSGFAMVPFTTYDRHIYLPVRLPGSGEELMFMVDSGASMTVIDSTLAVRMGFPLGERMVGAGAGGTADFYMTKIDGFSIEGVSFTEQTVIAYPISGLIGRFVDIEVAGILGYDFLSRFVASIDYEKGILTLFEPDSATASATIDAPLIHNVFSLECVVDGLFSGTFLIDTGAANSLLQKSFSEEHGLFDDRRLTEISLMGAGGEESAYLARFDSLEIAGITIEEPVFALSMDERGIGAFRGISGIIGNDILKRFTVTLDYRNQRIGLERNGLFDKPALKDRSGITLERDASNRVLIYRVIPGSPAEEAGIVPGDILLSVDSRDVSSFESMEEIINYFRDREETEIEIGIEREGKRLLVSLKLRDYM
jgi:predicted aspartyl protease